MPIEILMPALSPTMKEGNLAKWLKKEGDKIKAGEVIAEIETDKATMEVEAVDEGILGKILIKEGTENVAVNSLIALILEEGEDKKSLASYTANTASDSPKSQNAPEIKEEKIATPNIANITSFSDVSSHIKASPLAKRIAKDGNINLSSLANLGTGPKGRIIKDDVLEFIAKGTSNSGGGVIKRNNVEYTAIKNNNIRKIIAKRLSESKQNIPHFYLSAEFKIDRLLDMRASLNEAAEIDGNGNSAYKISVNDLIIKASAMALKKVPQANSAWSDDAILLYNNIDIAVAVAIDGGLITPIVRNADQKSIPAISGEVKILAKKARDNKLQPEEFQGGSFSISNLGMYGIDNFNAIINPPQSCILAIGRGIEKPIVENRQIKIANMVNITLSCDHRLVDGVVGAEFLKALRRYIENPVLMMNF
jgi:pyruvate dehydrogenase E2 component (dihydrolipoamide acetyltransferase)